MILTESCPDIDSMEFDGEQFAELEDRLNLINHLKAKYGDSIENTKYHDDSVEKCNFQL